MVLVPPILCFVAGLILFLAYLGKQTWYRALNRLPFGIRTVCFQAHQTKDQHCEQTPDALLTESVPNQILSRLSGHQGKVKDVSTYNKNQKKIHQVPANSCFRPLPTDGLSNNKLDVDEQKPPERPPKRPHLLNHCNSTAASTSPPPVPRSSPPPLLPRASPNHQQKQQEQIQQPAHRQGHQEQPKATVNVSSEEEEEEEEQDENTEEEDAELGRIQESAQQLKNLHERFNRPTQPSRFEAIQRVTPSQHQPLGLRTSSPDLPLPPPPPPPEEDEEIVAGDEPLPPPPTPSEVNGILAEGDEALTSTRNSSGSPPLAYPKDSYMSYRVERQPGRYGFDGNYFRSKSPVTVKEEQVQEAQTSYPTVPGDPTTMDSSSLTPTTAWEKHHNIGRPGPTVVYQSDTLRPVGTVKAEPIVFNSNGIVRNSNKSSSDSKLERTPKKNCNLQNDENREETALPEKSEKKLDTRRLSLETPYKPAYRTQPSIYRGLPAESQCLKNGLSRTPTPTATSPVRKLSSNSAFRISLESLNNPQNSYKAYYERNGNDTLPSLYHRRPSMDQLIVPPISTLPADSSPLLNGSPEESRHSPQQDSNSDSSSQSSTENEHNQMDVVLENRQNRYVQEVTTQTTPSISKLGRVKKHEEFECEQLTQTLARQLPEEDRALQALLVPGPRLKTTADYMEGLFELEPNTTQKLPRRQSSSSGTPTKPGNSPTSLEAPKKSPDAGQLPADSAYFTTSESKARFLTRHSWDKAMDMKDSEDVGKKKEELISSINRKLEILRAEHLAIQDEICCNEELGQAVTERVEKLAKSNELDKYKLHVEEIDKITSLLLSLSGRLARAENAMISMAKDGSCSEERRTLEAKRDKLFEQHEEAKKLKENIDRRSQQVSNILHKYLSSEEYADYDHFIKMKSKLLMDSREIDDKIKLGEEQMAALKESLGMRY